MEMMIAKDLTVRSPDGNLHHGVTLWMRDGKKSYQLKNGDKIKAKAIEGGMFLVPPDVAALITTSAPYE